MGAQKSLALFAVQRYCVPAGAQAPPDRLQTPSRTHVPWPPRQSALVWQGVIVGVALQVFRMSHGPYALQALFISHVPGTPGCVSGKYWMPTPSPADWESRRKAMMASRTAAHFVVVLFVSMTSSIDPELSIMM